MQVLIPPCVWAEGCQQAIPLNKTAAQKDAVRDVKAVVGQAKNILIPYVFTTGVSSSMDMIAMTVEPRCGHAWSIPQVQAIEMS